MLNIIIFSLFFASGIMLHLIYEVFFSKKKAGDKKSTKIAKIIREGAFSFLFEEYTIISIVVGIISLLIYMYVSTIVMVAFITGSILSLTVGFFGMSAATQSNLNTALLAKEEGEKKAFLSAFSGGGVMGFAVAIVGLFGLYIFFNIALNYGSQFEAILSAFGLGASLVAFFARVGGGIYTKSADIGADLVGKLEVGIPEDDIRNPAVIADNVGDCVGDTAGMGADIYESYIASMVSAILLGYFHFPENRFYSLFPFIVSALGLIASSVSFVVTKMLSLTSKSFLRFSTGSSVFFFIIFLYIFIYYYEIPWPLFYTLIIGCLSGLFVGWITEYYTGGNPIKKLAISSETGAATNIIYGLSLGMESTVIPVIGLACGVFIAYMYAGHYGVALAAVSMLSTVATTMTIDGYGPIADNAGGIAEMASFGKDARSVTDKLDALGNTTAAVGKGFAIGSALLASLGVFSAFAEKAGLQTISLLDTTVLVGLFIGATIPFLISSFTMRSVGNAALEMVKEVRRQFKEIKGLMEGVAEADYQKCIAISTRASLREMILPGIITVVSPIFIFWFLGALGLAGFLAGATVSGVLLSLMMANTGGCWDNAKKYIESGHVGGKGSAAHAAAIIGDTVGDPFKDTSGPALNILIKLMSMIALLLVAL